MATYTTPRTPGTPREAPGGGPGGRGAPPGSVDPRRTARPGLRDRDPLALRTRPVTAPRHTRPITDPGTRPPKPAKPARPPKPVKPPRPAKPVKPPRPPKPAWPAEPTRSAARPAMSRSRPRHPRAPFILLLVGLLGGALVSLLVISTTLAEGSYRITSLQQQNANLAKQEQLLTQQVAQASSPTQIAQEAEQLGMRRNPYLQFINLKTGKVVKGQVSKADAGINVPGYTP
jgi:outer membrane biosynthesis protein TonB